MRETPVIGESAIGAKCTTLSWLYYNMNCKVLGTAYWFRINWHLNYSNHRAPYTHTIHLAHLLVAGISPKLNGYVDFTAGKL